MIYEQICLASDKSNRGYWESWVLPAQWVGYRKCLLIHFPLVMGGRNSLWSSQTAESFMYARTVSLKYQYFFLQMFSKEFEKSNC